MKKIISSIVFSLSVVSQLVYATPTPQSIVPVANSAFMYDGLYDSSGNKLAPLAGLFVGDITSYNANVKAASHKLVQITPYGGDIEMYCQGSGGSDPSTACVPSSFLVDYYPPAVFNASLNNWTAWPTSLGDSGFRSTQLYQKATSVTNTVVNIDGRVDQGLTGGYDYLDELNTLDQTDAQHFADIVAKNICADDTVAGVVFDVEPFSFTGAGGTYQGAGQQYFYTEIAKDFGGYYGNAGDPPGVNYTTPDPLGCVDARYPNGRTFGVFTFSKNVTPAVVAALIHHNNGYVIDSLYDLDDTPGGTYTPIATYTPLVNAEVANMAAISVPFKFAIPASASAHEFETISNACGGGIGAGGQIQYVEAALNAIAPVRSNPFFKGVVLWSWNSAMWWGGLQFTPAAPEANVISYLQANL